MFPSSRTTKLILSTKAPLSIHSTPSCQPSTVGGCNNPCPMKKHIFATSSISNVGELYEPAIFIAPTTNSTGPFTRS